MPRRRLTSFGSRSLCCGIKFHKSNLPGVVLILLVSILDFKNILNKLNSVSLNVSDDSISNEVVNQIIKSDISEEIDRLDFHKSSLLEELASKKAKGKKIDFILLEMLREVNTILAKVTFSREKKYALDIKIYIEEMREQVSNVE